MNTFLFKSLLLMKLVLCCLGENKILGGREAKLREFPFMASIGQGADHQCGGTIMSARHVLTACHCLLHVYRVRGVLTFIMKSPAMVTVVVGTENLGKNRRTGVARDAQTLRKHPQCVKHETGWVYDFGIIVIREELEMIPGQIQIIPLPSFNQTSLNKLAEEKEKCQAMGWGATKEDSDEPSPHLLEVDLELVDPTTCARLLKTVAEMHETELRYNKETQLCTLGDEGKDACQGDSGGPLLCDNGFGKRIFIAIVSWGIGCGRFETPGVWARLDITETWIRESLLSGAPVGRITFLIHIVSVITTITMFHFTLLSCMISFRKH